MQTSDFIVVGGGLVGSCTAYGLSKVGAKVTLIDEGDMAFRAARGNFGLVWVQSKGAAMPRYAGWTRDGAALWPALARDLAEDTGIDVELKQSGGFWLGFSEEEVAARVAVLKSLQDKVDGLPFELMTPAQLKERLPALGPEVVGGTYCPLDGHVNPLKLLHALHAGARKRGVRLVNPQTVGRVEYSSGVFTVHGRTGTWQAPRVVMAAGLGTPALAAQVGLHAPVQPNRGQVLITERLEKFLDYPTNKARQTEEGTVQLGTDVREYVGFNDLTDIDNMRTLAQRAIRTFPILANARLVRAWGALRVMPPDGFAIYQESPTCPGAFVVCSHSGITLAAMHVYTLAPWMLGGPSPEGIEAFSGDRFPKVELGGVRAH